MILSFLWNFRLIFIPISPLLKLDFNCLTIFALSGVDKFPGNIRFDEDALKTSWRRLDQDKYIRVTYYSSSEDIFKKSSRCLDQDQYIRLGHTSSRRLQHVFKTSSRHFQDLCKTFWRRLEEVLQKSLQDVFKKYHQVKLFLLTHFQNNFETYSKRFWDVLQRRLSTEGFA